MTAPMPPAFDSQLLDELARAFVRAALERLLEAEQSERAKSPQEGGEHAN